MVTEGVYERRSPFRPNLFKAALGLERLAIVLNGFSNRLGPEHGRSNHALDLTALVQINIALRLSACPLSL